MTWLAAHVAHLLWTLAALAVIFGGVWAVGYLERMQDRRRVARQVEEIVAAAQAEHAAWLERRAGADLADRYASEHPMRRRPEMPVAGEPWRLPDADDGPGAPATEPEINPRIGGEQA